MKATIYGRGQMVIPARARKEANIERGDIVDVATDGDGRLILTRLEKPRSSAYRPRLVYRKNKGPVVVGGKKVSLDILKQLVSEFP